MKEKEIKIKEYPVQSLMKCAICWRNCREGTHYQRELRLRCSWEKLPKTVGNAIEYAGRVAEDDGFWKRLPETIDGVE